MESAPEPADAILELILHLEQEASRARRELGASLRRLGIHPEMTTVQLAETLRALGGEAPPLIERPDYEVRVVPPVGPRGFVHVWVKAGLAHHHGDEHVLMVPLEAETQDQEADAAAASVSGSTARSTHAPSAASALPSRSSTNSGPTSGRGMLARGVEPEELLVRS